MSDLTLTLLPEGGLAPQTSANLSSGDWEKRLMAAIGTRSPEFSQMILHQLISASETAKDFHLDDINALIAVLEEMSPRDPVEAMLICQQLSCHQQSMKVMQLAKATSHVDVKEQWLKIAGRLMSLFVKQTEALTRYRKKGHQSMKVEHIHLHDNAPAVIGGINN